MFLFRHAKINNMGATGQSLLPPKNDFEHARGPRNSTYAINLTYDRHTHNIIYKTYYTGQREICIGNHTHLNTIWE